MPEEDSQVPTAAEENPRNRKKDRGNQRIPDSESRPGTATVATCEAASPRRQLAGEWARRRGELGGGTDENGGSYLLESACDPKLRNKKNTLSLYLAAASPLTGGGCTVRPPDGIAALRMY